MFLCGKIIKCLDIKIFHKKPVLKSIITFAKQLLRWSLTDLSRKLYLKKI